MTRHYQSPRKHAQRIPPSKVLELARLRLAAPEVFNYVVPVKVLARPAAPPRTPSGRPALRLSGGAR